MGCGCFSPVLFFCWHGVFVISLILPTGFAGIDFPTCAPLARVERCWSEDYSWEFCCDRKRFPEGGNQNCWKGDLGVSYAECCVHWPGDGNDEGIARYEDRLLWGLLDGTVLTINQAFLSWSWWLSGHQPIGPNPQWVSGFLWPGGAALARWADCAGPGFWSGRRVLEVAAGVGLPAGIASVHGANATRTDIWPTRLLRRHSVLANGSRGEVRTRKLDMSSLADLTRLRNELGTFDIIIGTMFGNSELAKQEQSHESSRAMAQRLLFLLTRCRNAMVLAPNFDAVRRLTAPGSDDLGLSLHSLHQLTPTIELAVLKHSDALHLPEC
ncbi:unnamed protein product [Polarella glacialis]|uniref:Calmodulin-lysine N-methyltransferase n=1 Tax=Polarella glacialis TaxID=89957 RepID=A0A813GPJ1_POLGL|nr:unnamed protein product [Polarella glacialis]